MHINNKKTMERFIAFVGLIWLVYAGLWIYHIAMGMPLAGILLQGVILMIITGLLFFLWWLWKEAQY